MMEQGIVYTFGELHGLQGLKKNKRIEMAPFGLVSITTDKVIAEIHLQMEQNFMGREDWKII